MFNPSREQVRALFFETWRKYSGGEPLAGFEALALEAVLLHPEYHRVLEASERYREQEYFPELGETNPFLHLSLHVALEEQLAIDQPAGVRERFARMVLNPSTGTRPCMRQSIASRRWCGEPRETGRHRTRRRLDCGRPASLEALVVRLQLRGLGGEIRREVLDVLFRQRLGEAFHDRV